jgi:hypothetical protein
LLRKMLPISYMIYVRVCAARINKIDRWQIKMNVDGK